MLIRYLIGVSIMLGALLGEASGQVCGYVHARFFVTDHAGGLIKDAEFAFREADSDALQLHRPFKFEWQEEEGSYFLREGLCGGHKDVRLIVNAPGFDPLEQIIDLPLTGFDRPRIHRIILARIGAEEAGVFELVSRLTGKVTDLAGAVIPGARVTATGTNGSVFTTVSDSHGVYELELPHNRLDSQAQSNPAKYVLRVESIGFSAAVTTPFVFTPSQEGEMKLDIPLDVLSNPCPCGPAGTDCDFHLPDRIDTGNDSPTRVFVPRLGIDKEQLVKPE